MERSVYRADVKIVRDRRENWSATQSVASMPTVWRVCVCVTQGLKVRLCVCAYMGVCMTVAMKASQESGCTVK